MESEFSSSALVSTGTSSSSFSSTTVHPSSVLRNDELALSILFLIKYLQVYKRMKNSGIKFCEILTLVHNVWGSNPLSILRNF